jgi:release factor glutamine methyltransferase
MSIFASCSSPSSGSGTDGLDGPVQRTPGAEAVPGTVLADTVNALRSAGCVFAEEEAVLLIRHAAHGAGLAQCVQQRASGIPLEYILGWAEFAGAQIAIRPGVFVPRRRTELLVRLACGLIPAGPGAPGDEGGVPSRDVVVDLCCGSGAVGAALLGRFPRIELHATDIDPRAAACARQNLEPVGGFVHEGDLFDALPLRLRGRVRVLVVNAPYVPTDAIRTMPPEARIHEPRISLDGGADGLDIHRRIAAGAQPWLSPAAHVLIETSVQQAAGTAGLLAAAGLNVHTVHADDLDGTVVVGSRSAPH